MSKPAKRLWVVRWTFPDGRVEHEAFRTKAAARDCMADRHGDEVPTLHRYVLDGRKTEDQ